MKKYIDINSYPVQFILNILLKDKSTKKNIIWATDNYESYGKAYRDTSEMDVRLISALGSDIIKPRIAKSLEEQQNRTRKKAEVFTPSWVCNKMNNYCDEQWFGRRDVFNVEGENTWTSTEGRVEFKNPDDWKKYIDSRRLEITCGEAPFIVSRYDSSTGDLIEIKDRIGILDRKLRIVNENAADKGEWIKWTIRAIESCYGYEYQGDNLLIARINILMTFYEYYKDRWDEEPDKNLLQKVANKIAWNIWQMDGLKGTVPLGKPYEEFHQMSLFEDPDDETGKDDREQIPCRVYDWRREGSILYNSIGEGK